MSLAVPDVKIDIHKGDKRNVADSPLLLEILRMIAEDRSVKFMHNILKERGLHVNYTNLARFVAKSQKVSKLHKTHQNYSKFGKDGKGQYKPVQNQPQNTTKGRKKLYKTIQ